MKIASVTFYQGKQSVGGGQIPAYAFKKWCDIKKVNCQVIEGCDCADKLKLYDFVFFNTPPLNYFDYQNMRQNYLLMVHDETDSYGKYPLLKPMSEFKKCIGIVHIDFDNDFYKDYHNTRLYWHPCCFPENLIDGSEFFNKENKILYAAGITRWKNTSLMKDFCEKYNYEYDIFGIIRDKKYAEEINYSGNRYDNLQYKNYDIFWDACGTKTNKMLVKRINLTAFEAFKNGLMPIVNCNSVPRQLRNTFIEVDIENFSEKKLVEKINEYRHNRNYYFSNAIKIVNNSYASYNSISVFFDNILKVVKENVSF